MSILSDWIATAGPAGTKSSGRLSRRFGRRVLVILSGLLAVILALPVAVLPFATAVPAAVWLILVLAGSGLLIFLLTRAHAPSHYALGLAGLLVVSVLAVVSSQRFATTPPILDASGQPLPGSITELTSVDLNGREQWITIRGQDSNKPILLFLAGGPGGSQLAATRTQLGELEEQFVVVNWDQPGAGKSYAAADFAELTPEQVIADAHELMLYLRQRFDQEKIYIMGESWGSLLGIWLAQRYPDEIHALASAAQMVAFLETDTYDYELALQIAHERGDSDKMEALRKQGPPPYYGDGVATRVTEYILYLSTYMNQNPAIHSDYDTFGDIAAPEYGLYDKVNYVRGLLQTMQVLWPQLWEVDLRQQAVSLEVPVYFLEGRHDVNAPPALVEDYLEKLEAPHKELIWFEHSGHSPWVEESDKVVDVMVNQILRDSP